MKKTFHIIPAIDILDGKVVRLTQGDYNKVDHYNYSPAELAKSFQDNGATRIHLVDLDGAKDGQLTNRKTFEAIRKSVTCPLELGGGIRTEENLTTLFDIGIDYLILGSLFIKAPELSIELCHKYPQKLIAGIDAHGENVAIQGWIESSNITVETLLNTLKTTPLESVIYTDISKDGTLQGPNIHALKNIAAKTHHNIIASGGVGNLQDIHTVQNLPEENIYGCIVGKALLSGKIDIGDIWHKK